MADDEFAEFEITECEFDTRMEAAESVLITVPDVSSVKVEGCWFGEDDDGRHSPAR